MVKDNNSPIQVTIIGAGNVAWHLGHACLNAGIRIVRVINKTKKTAQVLARELGADVSTDFSTKLSDCDFVLVAVKDAFLREVLSRVRISQAIIIHTSGSYGLDIFPPGNYAKGVLYPFQTLTKGFQVDFTQIPICIEASDESTLSTIRKFASRLSSRILEITSIQRKYLHLSGIVINNFTNHLITRTFDYLDKHNLDRKLILPLLVETIRKLQKISPYDAQTGPARRGDMNIINEHLEMLSEEPELKKLYSLLTDSIIAYYS